MTTHQIAPNFFLATSTIIAALAAANIKPEWVFVDDEYSMQIAFHVKGKTRMIAVTLGAEEDVENVLTLTLHGGANRSFYVIHEAFRACEGDDLTPAATECVAEMIAVLT